jgi:hypothetical protein
MTSVPYDYPLFYVAFQKKRSKKNGDNYVLLIVGCQSINDLSLRVRAHKSYVWHALPDSDEILDKTYQTNFYEMKWKSPRINLFLQQTR